MPKTPRTIDLETWHRREQFALYRRMNFPYFGLTCDVSIRPIREELKACGASLTVGIVYALARAANGLEAFRLRIRGDRVIEHDVVHPSITVEAENGSFRFCTLEYHPTFERFAASAMERIAAARSAGSLFTEPDRDDFLFMTSIPWVSFTSMMHPVPLDPPDSVPRIAWGRIVTSDTRAFMPVNVQVHHAIMDGVHVGRFFEQVESLLCDEQTFARR